MWFIDRNKGLTQATALPWPVRWAAAILKSGLMQLTVYLQSPGLLVHCRASMSWMWVQGTGDVQMHRLYASAYKPNPRSRASEQGRYKAAKYTAPALLRLGRGLQDGGMHWRGLRLRVLGFRQPILISLTRKPAVRFILTSISKATHVNAQLCRPGLIKRRD